MDTKNSVRNEFWDYLSQNQKDLLLEGDYLINNVISSCPYKFKDYSFLVFPYAKAYEGYLKTLFKDIGFISHLDYISDHLRLGKLLSPFLMVRLGEKSLYKKIINNAGKELAEEIWMTWKGGRNQIFHYFPHNLKSISFEESQKIITQITQTMEKTHQSLIQLNPKSKFQMSNQIQIPNIK
ncbi:MAG: hypothetical protein HYW86_05445 [Candidatus Roizmanbacteria bacterium]|nr:MAG: hypothetical protein HYW86_05445 [Candidatus Roizmanbacteria bacterium]